MDIIQRNFMRLLRCGAFNSREPLEPMSAWKWNRLYEVSQIHGVTPWIKEGIRKCKGDFFLMLRPELIERFDADHTDATEAIGQQEFTNPALNRKLQQIADSTRADDATLQLLLRLIAMARNILTQGISLRQLIIIGQQLHTSGSAVDYILLRTWLRELNMQRIALLEGSLLVHLMGFTTEEVKFADVDADKDMQRVVRDIFEQTEKHAAEWYFTQGKSIFVRTNDSDAMIWHFKHSAKYLHYYPHEALTNFFQNFAHSLSHIEE